MKIQLNKLNVVMTEELREELNKSIKKFEKLGDIVGEDIKVTITCSAGKKHEKLNIVAIVNNKVFAETTEKRFIVDDIKNMTKSIIKNIIKEQNKVKDVKKNNVLRIDSEMAI